MTADGQGVTSYVLKCIVSEFELQSRYYIHFQTNTFGERHESCYPLPCYGFFYKVAFGIKSLKKFDMPLNLEIKPDRLLFIYLKRIRVWLWERYKNEYKI